MRNKMSLIMNYLINCIVFFIFIILQGCAGPVLLIYPLLQAGYAGTKLYQLSTGTSVEVVIKESPSISPENKDILTSLETVAMASKDPAAIFATEELEKHYNVVTPYKFWKNGLEKMGAELTNFQTASEITEILIKAGELVNADIVFYATASGFRQDTTGVGFKRLQQSQDILVYGVSPEYQRIIWQKEFKIIIKAGGSTPTAKETTEVIAKALVDQFLEDIKKLNTEKQRRKNPSLTTS